MKQGWYVVAVAVATVSWAGVASAQDSGSCRVELVQAGVGRTVGSRTFGSGGVYARCLDQPTTMRSDSVAWYPERETLDFVGTVRFRDSTMTLDADRVRYFTADERLEAYGNVQLVNRNTGSVLSGPTLTYYRAVPGIRDTVELFATRRPTVEYRAAGDSAAPAYLIVGDRVRLRGAGAAWAAGAVTIDREDFSAKSDSAELDTERGDGMLIGHAEAAGQDSSGYRINGRKIAFRLVDDRLTWVQAQGLARARSAAWRVMGDTIEFLVDNDLIQGGSAWGDSTRPLAASERHTITSDSLAFDTPDQMLREVRAFGGALATSSADSLSSERDWMAGDTVVAQFDSTDTGERALTQLDARGNAAALYYIFDEEDPNGLPAISYSRGARITARFKGEELDRVDVVDGADGIYLEPSERRRP